MNYSTLCFKFTLKLTVFNKIYIFISSFMIKKIYPLPTEMIFNFHFRKLITILYYYVSILYLKKNLVNWTDSEHLYTVNFDNLFII